MSLGSIRDQAEEIQTERQIPIFERDGQRIPVAQVGRQPQHNFQRIMNDVKVKRQELLTKYAPTVMRTGACFCWRRKATASS
jgi:hypothetical protein